MVGWAPVANKQNYLPTQPENINLELKLQTNLFYYLF